MRPYLGAQWAKGIVDGVNYRSGRAGRTGFASAFCSQLAQFGSVENAMQTQKILDGFKKVQPDISVEVQAISASDWDGFATKLLTQIAAGDVPDLINVATEGLQLFAGKGLVAPMNDLIMRDKDQLKEFFADVHPSLIEAMMYDGQVYALPDNFNAANIFYSKGAF